MTGKIHPLLRWIGGKFRNISKFTVFLPQAFRESCYVEPFLGSGAMLFEMRPRTAVVNDINDALIDTYTAVKTFAPDLISKLSAHDDVDSERHYYGVRDRFNKCRKDGSADIVEQAARFIYLNARCFNGLYRENSDGDMNSPYARGLKGMKKICNARNIACISDYLNNSNVRILCKSYLDIIPDIDSTSGDREVFFFMDPPYFPLSETASFTSYNKSNWREKEFVELRSFVDDINSRGWLFLLCNHDVPFIEELFDGYFKAVHSVSRSVSCKARERTPVDEILIANYDISRRQSRMESL